MTDRWFRVPLAGSGTEDDPYRPDYLEQLAVRGYAGTRIANSPQFVVRVYADTSVLDDLADKAQVTALGDTAGTALADAAHVTTSAPNQSFRVGGAA